MKAIEIWDMRGGFFLTLSDVLAALPDRKLISAWEIADFVDADGERELMFGMGDERISDLANSGTRVLGHEFISIAESSPQAIWATFSGYEPATATVPWIRLHAIDSTFWRCETRDIGSRRALMKSFRVVRLKAP